MGTGVGVGAERLGQQDRAVAQEAGVRWMLRLEEKNAKSPPSQAHLRPSLRLLLLPGPQDTREKQPASCGHPHLSDFPDVSLPFQG